METAALVDSLASALGGDGVVVDGLGRYAVDGCAPRIAIFPRSVEEASRALAVATQHKASVVPWGGGAHMALGNVPHRYDIALCLSRLDQVLEYEPADLTV
ncbi:MAG: FAD-binding oxidoreductase, partial [Dehalococcoidia bacterium]